MSIEVMKQALEALDMMIVPRSFHAQVRIKEIYETIEAELAKQEHGCEFCNHPMYVGTKCKNCGATKQEQGEPVAWLITDEAINSIQVASIQRLIDRLKHAHHTDLCVRINGQDEWFQADWIKHLKRANQHPKREPLTDEQMDAAIKAWFETDIVAGRQPFAKRMRAAFAAAHGIKGEA